LDVNVSAARSLPSGAVLSTPTTLVPRFRIDWALQPAAIVERYT
jgi:hypothetical protein